MKNDLTNKIALVCGSTQGIGRETAQQMANLGATIVLVARNEDKLKQIVTELPAPNNQEHRFLVADFSNPNQLKSIMQEFVSSGNAVDILVNNTGGPKGGPIIDADIS